MDSGDIVGIVFFLLIVGSLVLPWARAILTPSSGSAGPAPRSFTESGGYRPAAQRSVQGDAPDPRDQRRQGVFGDLEGVLPERGETPLGREEALEQDPSTDVRQSAEERTRRRPIAPLIVLAQETETAGQIRLQFRSRQAVRTAIIMREVLDRPVGLREES